MNEIEIVAKEARTRLEGIPFAKREEIDFCVFEMGDPIVYYEHSEGIYYQIVSERGCEHKREIATSREEMVDYFVHEAVWRYALRYELNNRHKFESNLRQTHTIMEFCYSFIQPQEIYTSDYDDEVHICLDLLKIYRTICKEMKTDIYERFPQVHEDFDYIIHRKYADTEYGGIKDTRHAVLKVHQCIERIQIVIPECVPYFEQYERYYKKLNL